MWYHGTASPPLNTLGKDGDYYLNVNSYDVYTKTNGAWAFLVNIKGATGQQGQQGTSGTDFNSTGNVHLYNGTNSYNAQTALVSEGIGSIAWGFHDLHGLLHPGQVCECGNENRQSAAGVLRVHLHE